MTSGQGLPFQILCVSIAAIVMALIGPFGTYGEMTLEGRLAFWSLSMASGWILMTGIVAVVNRIEPLQAWPVAGRMALAGLAGGVPMTGIVWLIEALFRHAIPLASLPELFLNTVVLTIAVAVAIGQIVELRLQVRAGDAELRTPPVIEAASTPLPPSASADGEIAAKVSPGVTLPPPADGFLRRLPSALGRDLLALEMEDHYARVHTALGSTLVLLRLRDAVTELGEGSGLQVHRSWWVAHGAVVRTIREAGKVTLVLRNGLQVPVSKTYREVVRGAGWGEGG